MGHPFEGSYRWAADTRRAGHCRVETGRTRLHVRRKASRERAAAGLLQRVCGQFVRRAIADVSALFLNDRAFYISPDGRRVPGCQRDLLMAAWVGGRNAFDVHDDLERVERSGFRCDFFKRNGLRHSGHIEDTSGFQILFLVFDRPFLADREWQLKAARVIGNLPPKIVADEIPVLIENREVVAWAGALRYAREDLVGGAFRDDERQLEFLVAGDVVGDLIHPAIAGMDIGGLRRLFCFFGSRQGGDRCQKKCGYDKFL